MTISYSISEAKQKLSYIGKTLKKGVRASVLKNGKPLFFIIPSEDMDEYEKLKKIQKQREWDMALEYESVSDEEKISISKGKKEIRKTPVSCFSARELMDKLSNS